MNTGATFDSTGQYRYSLWRHWDDAAPRIGFVMLNPSRADATLNDPTIRRCLSFARSWGYGSLEVVNLFAYRTAQPQQLRHVADPVGTDNDRTLQTLSQRVDRIILAWGNWGRLQDRDRAVLTVLKSHSLHCLGRTKLGHPCHPLYLKGTLQPIEFLP
ncbi:MAG: DUF1643 domain-containing protein [Leptolyngbyaceae cyanobacterium bins.349]|nr:DUF1643 domain-containing protein [Leptolyngbyaceae cyanobacterium bins.349]